MTKKKNGKFFIVPVLSFFFVMTSCQTNTTVKDTSIVQVMIEDSSDYKVNNPIKRVTRGESVTFTLTMIDNAIITSISYEDHTLESQDGKILLSIHNVFYPTVVSIETTKDVVTYMCEETTFTNGEHSYVVGKNSNHLRYNSLNSLASLDYDGYVLKGWKTSDGEEILLGSRVNRDIDTLYADFVKETDPSSFTYTVSNGSVEITSFIGDETDIVIPLEINGNRVISIASNAFENKEIDSLILSYNLTIINQNAFINSDIDSLYIYDNLINISDASFNNSSVHHLFINALKDPCYSGTYYDSFNDKMDYLLSIQDEKKIVLFSGSSTRYGYYSPAFMEAFPDYKTINMGVFAYFSANIQYDIFKTFLKEGDILIDAPEFDASNWQFFTCKEFENRLFYMFEGNYQNLAYADISAYSKVFDSYKEYQEDKAETATVSYDRSCFHLDDEENYYEEEIYNIYGDFILDRVGNQESGIIYQQPVAYTRENFTQNHFDSINSIFQECKENGISFFFNYAPRNKDSLTSESTFEERALLDSYLKEQIEAPFLSSIEDNLYPASYFYLIDNHLTSEGALLRSQKTIENLLSIGL